MPRLNLVAAMQELRYLGIGFVSLSEALDPDDAYGTSHGVIAVFAQVNARSRGNGSALDWAKPDGRGNSSAASQRSSQSRPARKLLIDGFGLMCYGSRTRLSPEPSRPSPTTKRQLANPRA